jgi:pimeloyl-ACP methyl ester carboxylesterase
VTAFVLVHGAFHGGWCFRKLARLLEDNGHEVFTPTLTGLGERSHLLKMGSINLETHIRDVVNTLVWEDLTNVVLCGHSYGGMVISGVADLAPERIATLVYLDALVPQNGDTVLALTLANLDLIQRDLANSNGLSLPPTTAAFFGIPSEGCAHVDTKLTPHPFASLAQAIELLHPPEPHIKRVYVGAELGIDMLKPFHDNYRADPDWTYRGLPCGHNIMTEAPEALADILTEL